MNKIALFALLAFGVQVYGDNFPKKTEALHIEAKEHKNPNLTQDTHPILYAMVKDLTTKAQLEMPKYITVYEAEHSIVTKNGTVYKTASDICAWSDALGDLHICHEILTNLSYAEVEGILAVAIAEKVKNKPVTLALVAVCSVAATVALAYMINKCTNGSIDSFVFGDSYAYRYQSQDRFETLIWLIIGPACLTTKIASNNLQKIVDFQAAEIVDPQLVIDGIKSLTKLEETYIKENFFSRIASTLKLKSIYNTLFYPVRAFNPEERIQYLELLAAK